MKFLINNLNTDWKIFLDKEFKKDYLINIDEFLHKNSQIKNIFPKKEDIFRSLNFFNIQETKVVIFGQDPYHNINQANGLAFSVNENIKLPPSLKNMFKKLFLEKNINKEHGDLSSWAQQGFLLLNTVLTVFENEPLSHKNLKWENLILNIISLLNKNENKIMFVLLGNQAKKIKKWISNKHYILEYCHPSPLSAYKNNFFENDFYKIIEQFLLKEYNKEMKW